MKAMYDMLVFVQKEWVVLSTMTGDKAEIGSKEFESHAEEFEVDQKEWVEFFPNDMQ
jgi:hypothetical protein